MIRLGARAATCRLDLLQKKVIQMSPHSLEKVTKQSGAEKVGKKMA